MADLSAPKHTTSTASSRRTDRALAEARQAGTAAPEVDSKTGKMINPHNPEFITKRPWYLGGGDGGASLEHQAVIKDQKEIEREALGMGEGDRILEVKRTKALEQKRLADSKNIFTKGMWVESLYNGKKPYQMAYVLKVNKKKGTVDLRFDDRGGEIKKGIKIKGGTVRATKVGNVIPDDDINKGINRGSDKANTYASKRDAYAGYDVADQKIIVEKYNQREDVRKKNRQQALEARMRKGEGKKDNGDQGESDDSDYDSDDSDDSGDEFVDKTEAGFASRMARQGGVGGAQIMVTARNLRIREDTAKYLRNLNPNSAYYDPKSRSMRDNPNPERSADDSEFMGDNFARVTGDAVGLANTQLFAWDASDSGVDGVHPQACPSAAETMSKQFEKKKSDLKVVKKKGVLDKYGGAEYLDGGDGLGGAGGTTGKVVGPEGTTGETVEERNLRLNGASVVEQVYKRDGQSAGGKGGGVGGNVKLKQVSKYEEDNFENGHQTVWGSYFHRGAFRWGYLDDHSLMKNSYCTGQNGKIANDESNAMKYGNSQGGGSAALNVARAMLEPRTTATLTKDAGESNNNAALPGVDKKQKRKRKELLYGDVDGAVELDENKLAEAMAAEKERVKKAKTTSADNHGRKGGYNSLAGDNIDVTPEEMEAYRLNKKRAGDNIGELASDKLLEYE